VHTTRRVQTLNAVINDTILKPENKSDARKDNEAAISAFQAGLAPIRASAARPRGSVGGDAGADVSAPVQAVFDRMSALTTTEENAIETFVDGMVAEGMWADVFEFYAPCLNGTDFLTGFLTDTLLPSGLPPVHTAGQYLDFLNNAMHVLEGRNFETYSTQDIFFGAYVVMYDADGTGNSDVYGISNGGADTYMRWRGDDTNDFNEHIGQTSSANRSLANLRPTGDFVGLGRLVNGTYNLQPAGAVILAVQPFVAHPSGGPVQWHGNWNNGTPSAGNMANSRYSCMISMVAPEVVDIEKLRALVLQFLREVGVTGIPAPAAAMTTENGDILTTEAGDTLIT